MPERLVPVPENAFCARHKAPMQGMRDITAHVFMHAMQVFAAKDEVIEETECQTVDAVQDVLQRYSPICCYIGDDEMADIYEHVGLQL